MILVVHEDYYLLLDQSVRGKVDHIVKVGREVLILQEMKWQLHHMSLDLLQSLSSSLHVLLHHSRVGLLSRNIA